MKIYIENYACMNRSDELFLIKNKVLDKGFKITENIEEANYVLIYTCGSTEAFIKRSFDAVNKIYTSYPSKKIIVCGCSSVTARYLYKDMDLIFCTPTNFSQLKKELDISITKDEIRKAQLTKDVKNSNNVAIVVQKGCTKQCTYCSIWMAVGKIVSKNMGTIIDEVKKCVENGNFNITITGDCISDYGLDTNSNIIDLIDNICKVSDKIKLSVYDIHPTAFLKYADEFIRLTKQGKFEHLGIPIQSGSPKILKLMNRYFDVEKFIELTTFLKNCDVKLSTDIIIGFPNEEQEDFDKTVDILKKIDFDDISVNMYTDTQYNVSSKMTGKVSNKEVLKRYIQLENERIRGVNKDFFEYQFMKLLKK